MAKTKASETGATAKRGRGRPSKAVNNTDESEPLQAKKLKVAETVAEENGQEAKVEASDVEKTEPAAAKKGRGRPKKAETEAESSATEAKVEEPSSAVKKGRGRPKAPAKAANGGANKAKKGRGRPKKADSSENDGGDTASDDNDDGESA
ncbi:putative wings apart-like protein like protein isoform X2 [Ditylenchus destructor]|uniref:Wings apart-like protein like protein isoform X2 n=1 Tax=Ditylenchus destructor TaxID=166010 RepID=A0AAD4NA54_9BILA|nr:putative wings apart-like protein like protein isoform X2 [Ditylenchus destructor]